MMMLPEEAFIDPLLKFIPMERFVYSTVEEAVHDPVPSMNLHVDRFADAPVPVTLEEVVRDIIS